MGRCSDGVGNGSVDDGDNINVLLKTSISRGNWTGYLIVVAEEEDDKYFKDVDW